MTLPSVENTGAYESLYRVWPVPQGEIWAYSPLRRERWGWARARCSRRRRVAIAQIPCAARGVVNAAPETAQLAAAVAALVAAVSNIPLETVCGRCPLAAVQPVGRAQRIGDAQRHRSTVLDLEPVGHKPGPGIQKLGSRVENLGFVVHIPRQTAQGLLEDRPKVNPQTVARRPPVSPNSVTELSGPLLWSLHAKLQNRYSPESPSCSVVDESDGVCSCLNVQGSWEAVDP